MVFYGIADLYNTPGIPLSVGRVGAVPISKKALSLVMCAYWVNSPWPVLCSVRKCLFCLLNFMLSEGFKLDEYI